jgi:hypothetical protein
MSDRAALRVAVELLHMPWRVRSARSEPLPEGMQHLLEIAAGEVSNEETAGRTTGRSPDLVQQAATFFIEQVLLAPGADSYRVLGATPSATTGDLRRNMALLMRWLHPDVAREGEQAVYAARISKAWNDLKTPERRAAYDAELQQRAAGTAPHEPAQQSANGAGPRGRGARGSMRSRRPRRSGLARVLAFLLPKARY